MLWRDLWTSLGMLRVNQGLMKVGMKDTIVEKNLQKENTKETKKCF